jgi:biofilm PGA synthesis N-glycosyltransferase PgaC
VRGEEMMSDLSSGAKMPDSTVNTGDIITYVLITPARNEAAFIELTIKSVINQTVLPAKWVIVSDGSTDGTDDIVRKYIVEYPWIKLVRMPERTERNFAGKVYAFNAGFVKVMDLKYDIIGSLDADISFENEYFSFLLSKFAENPRLGVGGTPFREGSHQYDYRFTSIEHVSGACQLFRRECFEQVGGYIPIKGGGIDWTAVTTARMKGWQTRSFPEKVCVHHRIMGTSRGSVLSSRFRFGKQDYFLGGHPLWEVFRCLYQMKTKPYILGGLFLFTGYFWAFLRGEKRPISRELVEFRRKEQMCRLKNLFRSTLGIQGNHDMPGFGVRKERPQEIKDPGADENRNC